MSQLSSQSLTVAELLDAAKAKIASQEDLTFSEPSLEARVLFEHVSGNGHSWQIAHAHDIVDANIVEAFTDMLSQRLNGKPIAFITGSQDFWSLNLAVDESTLIPRQDTETLVELALALPVIENANVLDLGTGTGAIALALAKERPQWQIKGVDRIDEAVALAKRNAQRNQLKVSFEKSHWFSELSGQCFHLIVTNPPYVEQNSDYLQQGDLRFEPLSALTSGKDGLDDIRLIAEHAYEHLHHGGYLLIEHGASQANSVAYLLNTRGFEQIENKLDYNHLPRVTLAQKPLA
jgi:release factor glutamine methyltransferase